VKPYAGFEVTSPPALSCLSAGHVLVDIFAVADGVVLGAWCLWCGSAAYDGDAFDEATLVPLVPMTVRVRHGEAS
jgi:hypothetical protein